MDRTHSIMRIATTASPVSGADVRDRKRAIYYMRKIPHSVEIISKAWLSYKNRKKAVQIIWSAWLSYKTKLPEKEIQDE